MPKDRNFSFQLLFSGGEVGTISPSIMCPSQYSSAQKTKLHSW